MRVVALLEVVQVHQYLVQSPVQHHRTWIGFAQELRHDLERRLGDTLQARTRPLDAVQHVRARRVDLLPYLAERTRVAGQAEVAVQAITPSDSRYSPAGSGV